MREACLFALALLVAGCHDSSKDHPAPAVSMAKVTLSAPPGGSVHVGRHAEDRTVCRAIEARGRLTVGDAGVKQNDVLGDGFVELPEGAHLAIEDGTSTRETLFDGPGAVRPCVGGEEEMWMPSGLFTSVVGAGETPGSEVWVVTPHVVVRYGAGAQLKLRGTSTKVEATLKAGTAWAYPVGSMLHDGGMPRESEGWLELPGNETLVFVSKRAPSQLVTECEKAATAARDLALRIGAHDASLAQAAPAHVVARRRARAVCAVAELVAARSFDLVERERLLPRARAADATWRNNSATP